MILVDVNLLVYAHVEQMPEHMAAKAWLDERLAGPAQVGLPWSSLLGFMRLVTNRRIFEHPETSLKAWGVIERWLAQDAVWIPGPTERHPQVLGRLVEQIQPSGDDVPDTHLAALAIEHELTLATADRGFRRFPGLRWENPLTGESNS